ncbi:hypothetical protein [Jongsikchunia kroppenstedtii]|uniref:hypothetical protein n=1 Tax=Jongsikchunia kroppenstedtii TaxID=1121721 RepID=UPI00035F8190|nr:hypothetical protein [Jongsikchunia kroppenstedtii]
MTRLPLTADTGTGASTFATASVAAPADARIIVFVASAETGLFPATPDPPAISGLNLTFAQLNTVVIEGVDRRRLTAFIATSAAAATGAVTFSFANKRQDLCAWSVIAYTGVATKGPLASFVASGTGTDLSVTTPVTGAGLSLVAAVTVAAATAVNPGGGATEVQEASNQSSGREITLETAGRDSAAPAMTWQWADNASALGIAVALLAASAPTGPRRPGPSGSVPLVEVLARKFAPILHLHPAERFVPVDAKRYVEHSALWQSNSPFDTTDSWGGVPGDPYPRRPLAAAGTISARVGEPGTSIGDQIPGTAGGMEGKFLQFAGWTDGAGRASDTIDVDSVSTYGNADAIAGRYANEPGLNASRYWYHAEYIDSDKLLARAAGPRGLDRVLQTYASRPALLCYYLFYPFHSESVGQDSGDCAGSVAAQQALSHAGDWHCVALLFDEPEDDAQNTEPRLVGTTVSRLSADDGGSAFPAYSRDAAGGPTMTVRSWRPATGLTSGLPKLVDGHPRIYVADGTHSMYLSPGERPTVSAGTAFCGRFDPGVPVPPDLIPHSDEDLGRDMLTFLAKFLGGAGIGGALGGVLGPVGLAAGLVAAGAEGVLPHAYGLDVVGYGDVPDTDKPPEAEESTVLAPPGVTVPNVAVRNEWASQRALDIDGRTYDFVVDRETQTFWPSTDQESGFRGRWGERVTSDPESVRAGPQFPDMVGLFLDAVAYGDNRCLFPT